MTDIDAPYSKQKLSGIERTITSSIHKMKQNGLTIISKGWGTYANRDDDMYPRQPNWYSPSSKCSPLGALLLDKQIKEAIVCFPENAYIATVCQILKVSYYFANAFHLASIGQIDTQHITCVNQSIQGHKLGIKFYNKLFNGNIK